MRFIMKLEKGVSAPPLKIISTKQNHKSKVRGMQGKCVTWIMNYFICVKKDENQQLSNSQRTRVFFKKICIIANVNRNKNQ